MLLFSVIKMYDEFYVYYEKKASLLRAFSVLILVWILYLALTKYAAFKVSFNEHVAG